MVQEIKRVLMITPPGSRAGQGGFPAVDWTSLATSLRRVGIAAEVYDASVPGRDLESVRAHIEHAWPHVVVTASDGTTPAGARSVLASAKEIVTGVVTVLMASDAANDQGDFERGAAPDHDLRGAREQAVVRLLVRLRDERSTGGATAPGHVHRRVRALFGA
jgi:hypothetical protein